MNEPRWRTVLNWSAVITFFVSPLVVFVLHVISEEPLITWFHFNEHIKEYRYLDRFYELNAALVFGLAGLHSWDKRINGDKK